MQSPRRLCARIVLRLFSSSGGLRMRVYRVSPDNTLRFIDWHAHVRFPGGHALHQHRRASSSTLH